MPDAEPLDAAIESLRAVLGGLSDGLQVEVEAYIRQTGISDAEELITELGLALPVIADPYVAAAADYTVVWYDELSPASPYQPVLPVGAGLVGGVIAPERIAASISWAVHTAQDVTPAEKLAGSLDRMVHDASRHVVQHNASRERVRYLRHAAAGACPWCRLMAIRGPVFKSAANAIKGHDRDRCVAIPIRSGTRFVPPAHYAAWETEYIDTAKALRAEGKAVNLSNVLAAFRASAAA